MTASFKQLLVHLDPSVAACDRLVVARRLALQHKAKLSALYATMPMLAGLPYAPEMAPEMAASLVAIDSERRDRTRKMFDETLATPGATASWGETLEVPVAGVVAQQALHADLVIVGQRNPEDALAAGVPPDFPEAVMIASGRPVLVIPYVGSPARVGDIVVIAWKETREAARAVAAAMPILRKARQVHVVSWSDEQPPEVQGARLDLSGYLRVHGVEPTWHGGGPEPRAVGELLLSRLADLQADLLVMGCYGHSRAREWMLGGASRSVLAAMTVPVLMAH